MKKTKYCIYQKIINKREASYSDYPTDMLTELKDYLRSAGIEKLYSHQAEMFESAINKNNIVITTSTASGKTMSFLLPVVQEILENPLTRAIFIYPTKALASDQYRAIKPILEYFGPNRISAGIYDGDTPVNERSRIRNNANIILTNPEMLNSAFLPHHSGKGFSFIFSNLKFVVVDELHTYRGTFGAHLANVFRRLKRVCQYYKSDVQYLCSSATIANPVELAETICDKPFVLIDKDGSFSPERSYYLIQPPFFGEKDVRKPVGTVASDMIPELTVENRSFIAFCKSRKTVEVVLKESRDKLKDIGIPGYDLSDLIAGYRGGYSPKERKEIENKMIKGTLLGLVSTNALELGIDIGKVDTTVLVGYPNTRASFWQQSGRAGRGKNSSETYLILDSKPFDQYIAVDPDWLFCSKSENAVLDKNNLLIQIAHVRAAAAEIPLSLDDLVLFPDLGEIIPVLIRANELRTVNGKWIWCGKEFPAGDYSLRNMDKKRYQLINGTNNSVIAEFDEAQAFREIYKGAVYMHEGQSYLVTELNKETRRGVADPISDDYYTNPMIRKNVSVIKEQKEKTFGRTKCSFGDVKVTEAVGGFKKLQFHNHMNMGAENLDEPLVEQFDSEGVWLEIPKNVSDLFMMLKHYQPNLNGNKNKYKDYFEAMEYAVANAAMMSTMTTNTDISSANFEFDTNDDDRVVSICLYDLYVGGIGYAEKTFEIMDDIVHNAIKMVRGCNCSNGCSACIGDHTLDKSIVLWGLSNLFEESEAPKKVNSFQTPKEIHEDKLFSFDTIAEHWQEFRVYLKTRGEYLSKFIAGIERVKVKENTLILVVRNEFIRGEAMSVYNKTMLKNILEYHIDVPVGFDIDAVCETNDDLEKTSKIARRHHDLIK